MHEHAIVKHHLVRAKLAAGVPGPDKHELHWPPAQAGLSHVD